jgi:hypothetical protein
VTWGLKPGPCFRAKPSAELDTTYLPTWESRFASFYAGTNPKVGERWGLDLGALGYPV